MPIMLWWRLLDYGKPAKESKLMAALFYKDSTGFMDNIEFNNGGANIKDEQNTLQAAALQT